MVHILCEVHLTHLHIRPSETALFLLIAECACSCFVMKIAKRPADTVVHRI